MSTIETKRRHTCMCIALALLSRPVPASLPIRMSLAEMVERADHVLAGHVSAVDMVDDAGRPVTDPEARTGPGENKVIRLRVAVEKVLQTNASQVPEVLYIPLDSFMHFSLGQIQEAHKGDHARRIVILKGPDFQPVAPGRFFANWEDRAEVLRLYRLRTAGAQARN